ncbi:MAG: helix-turn-helix transcriptional regulator [Roseburia sp.]|nr:helix-turn-helix transcriptional regulator [Roseburia sp.]
MNDIVYAGTTPFGDRPAADEYTANKAFKVFVPERGGNGGRILCPDAENGGLSFGWGETVIIPPNLPHRFSADTCGGITVLIERPLLPLNRIDVLSGAENDGIRHAAGQAVVFYESDSFGKEGVLAALGNLIISYITTFYPKTYSPAVMALREDIEKNMADSAYSADAGIRKLPLNYDYVRKLFKKEIGVTPHEYLTETRMKRARAILESGVTNRYSDYTVTQIAEACGFSEPLYFSRVFKKYYGVAPSHYLKNL